MEIKQQNETKQWGDCARCIKQRWVKKKEVGKKYLKFAGSWRAKTIILVIVCLTLIGAVQVQRDVSVGWLTGTRATARMPYSRSLKIQFKVGQYPNSKTSYLLLFNLIISNRLLISKTKPGGTFLLHRRMGRRISSIGHKSGGNDGYLQPIHVCVR